MNSKMSIIKAAILLCNLRFSEVDFISSCIERKAMLQLASVSTGSRQRVDNIRCCCCLLTTAMPACTNIHSTIPPPSSTPSGHHSLQNNNPCEIHVFTVTPIVEGWIASVTVSLRQWRVVSVTLSLSWLSWVLRKLLRRKECANSLSEAPMWQRSPTAAKKML